MVLEKVAFISRGTKRRKRRGSGRSKLYPKTAGEELRRRSEAQKKVYRDPVQHARACMNMAKARAARSSPIRTGVPTGWNRYRADAQRVYDGIKADLIIDQMKAKGMVDETKPGAFEVTTVESNGMSYEVRIPKTEEGMAEAALREAVIGAISPLTQAANRVSYIRTVLEWTKKKPATDSNVNLKSEEWLEAALRDNHGDYAGESSAS